MKTEGEATQKANNIVGAQQDNTNMECCIHYQPNEFNQPHLPQNLSQWKVIYS